MYEPLKKIMKQTILVFPKPRKPNDYPISRVTFLLPSPLFYYKKRISLLSHFRIIFLKNYMNASLLISFLQHIFERISKWYKKRIRKTIVNLFD